MKEYILVISDEVLEKTWEHPEDRPQELVRCKDCKYRTEEMYDYYHNPNDKRYVCQINDLAKKPDWFCADGKRRQDDA